MYVTAGERLGKHRMKCPAAIVPKVKTINQTKGFFTDHIFRSRIKSIQVKSRRKLKDNINEIASQKEQ